MDDALAMSGGERVGDLRGVGQRVGDLRGVGQRVGEPERSAAQPVGERAPVDELHDQVVDVLVPADVVERAAAP
jgi:hypothetical protein